MQPNLARVSSLIALLMLGAAALGIRAACSETPKRLATRHVGERATSAPDRSRRDDAWATELTDSTGLEWSAEELGWLAARLANATEPRRWSGRDAPVDDADAWEAWGYASEAVELQYRAWPDVGARSFGELGYTNPGAWPVPTGDAWTSWSSTYAHGASNADNSAGYVYVPGSGAVSYGF